MSKNIVFIRAKSTSSKVFVPSTKTLLNIALLSWHICAAQLAAFAILDKLKCICHFLNNSCDKWYIFLESIKVCKQVLYNFKV